MKPEDITVGDILYYFNITESAGKPKKLYFYKIRVIDKPFLTHMRYTLVPMEVLDYYAAKPPRARGTIQAPLESCYKIAEMTAPKKHKWIKDCFSLTD